MSIDRSLSQVLLELLIGAKKGVRDTINFHCSENLKKDGKEQKLENQEHYIIKQEMIITP